MQFITTWIKNTILLGHFPKKSRVNNFKKHLQLRIKNKQKILTYNLSPT